MAIIIERQSAKPITNPSLAKLTAELKALKSYGRSTFATLTRTDGSYVQVAGGGVGCLLELRDTSAGKHFRGFVSEPTVSFTDGTELVFGGGRVPLLRDEWMNIKMVTEVFDAFLRGDPFPNWVRWRDKTEYFWA